MGIDPANIESIKELWLNETVTYDNQQLSYNIPTKDARVYRMTKNTNTGIVNIEKEEATISIKGNYDDTVSIVAEKEITLVTIYNTSGTLLSKNICDGKKEVTLPLPTNNNIYIIKTVFADGSSNTTKCK
jgi:stress response protein YsnF